jgi:hypothetical protein
MRDGVDIMTPPSIKSRIALLVFAVLVSTPTPAYPFVDDVVGWPGLTWGMTEPEVRRSVDALGMRVITSHPPVAGPFTSYVPLKTSVELDGNTYDVAFRFLDRTERLDAVVVSSPDSSREQALKLQGSLLRTLTADVRAAA